MNSIPAPDWKAVRGEFPVCEKHVYLASAATGPVPRPVAEAARRLYEDLSANGELNWGRWSERREEIRRTVARFLNAEPDEIAFTANTSSGVNLVADLLEGEGGVVSTSLEFPTTVLPWMHRGIAVTLLPPAPDGRLDPGGLERELAKPENGVLALSHVQFSNGLRMDLEALGRLKGGKRLMLNATQSFGVFPIDVKAARLDALVATGHKWLCAGYGCGICYIDKALLDAKPARQIGWLSVKNAAAMRNDRFEVKNSAARAEMGCSNFSGIHSFGAAVDFVMRLGIENIAAHVLSLNAALVSSLREAGFRVLSPQQEASRSAETLVALAEPKKTAAALLELGIQVTEKPQGIRVATHYFNNEDDIERLMEGLRRVGAEDGAA